MKPTSEHSSSETLFLLSFVNSETALEKTTTNRNIFCVLVYSASFSKNKSNFTENYFNICWIWTTYLWRTCARVNLLGESNRNWKQTILICLIFCPQYINYFLINLIDLFTSIISTLHWKAKLQFSPRSMH